jgi:hypothetical protein
MTVVAEPPFALAVSVTDCALLTEAAVKLKIPVFAPAPTVTDAGSATIALLLARLTTIGFGAAELRFTVHAMV